jgi:glycosyltransferase involved in cell wall biosynthesis
VISIPKIAFLEENARIGGAEINVLNLLKNLDRRQFDPLAICPCEGPFTEQARAIGANVAIVSRLPLLSTSIHIKKLKLTNPLAVMYNLITFFPSALNLARFLKHEKVSVLHTNSMLAHFYGALAARLAGIPCLWHVQDIVDPKQAFGIMRKALSWSGKWLPHRIVAISRPVGHMFRGKASDKVRVVHNGTDIRNYSPNNSGDKIRREFNIKQQEAVIGIVGRIVPWKGHKVFLQADKLVRKRRPHTKFLIVGDTANGKNQYSKGIKRLTQQLGLGESVIFTGFRSDVPEILSAMDILVHASTLPEPFGLTIIEAMASGKPVVATNGGGVPEILVNGVTGRLVPMNDVDALADAIVELLDDPEKRRAMGKAGRERVKKYFSVETFVQNLSDQYLDLVFES